VRTLIIGYGNCSRRDDGAGWLVIERLAALGLPDVELQTAHQLEVDVAETISRFDVVIFVDAAVTDGPDAVTRTLVQPNPESRAVSHYMTPADVLALCRTLYGKEPQGMLFSIRGHDFGFGMELTPEVERAAHEVVQMIVTEVRGSGISFDELRTGSAATGAVCRTHLTNGGTGLRACPNSPAQAGTPVPPGIYETASR
jgi:hydrogenase maturation protease